MTVEERKQYIKDIERVRAEAKSEIAKAMVEAVRHRGAYGVAVEVMIEVAKAHGVTIE